MDSQWIDLNFVNVEFNVVILQNGHLFITKLLKISKRFLTWQTNIFDIGNATLI